MGELPATLLYRLQLASERVSFCAVAAAFNQVSAERVHTFELCACVDMWLHWRRTLEPCGPPFHINLV